jgi:hypothetical protein
MRCDSGGPAAQAAARTHDEHMRDCEEAAAGAAAALGTVHSSLCDSLQLQTTHLTKSAAEQDAQANAAAAAMLKAIDAGGR